MPDPDRMEAKLTESAFQARIIVCARANGWRIDVEDFQKARPTAVTRFLEMVRGRTTWDRFYAWMFGKQQALFSLVYHPFDSRNSQSGYPDLTMVHPRRRQVVFAELKKVGGYKSVEQKLWAAGLMCALRDTPNVNYYEWDPDDWPQIVEVLGGIDTGLLGRRRK